MNKGSTVMPMKTLLLLMILTMVMRLNKWKTLLLSLNSTEVNQLVETEDRLHSDSDTNSGRAI